jgi:hypothetical protein
LWVDAAWWLVNPVPEASRGRGRAVVVPGLGSFRLLQQPKTSKIRSRVDRRPLRDREADPPLRPAAANPLAVSPAAGSRLGDARVPHANSPSSAAVPGRMPMR